MEKKINIAMYCIALFFLVLVFRLWDLQLLKGGEYRKIDEHNRLRVLDIPAPRGIIYDRNGRALVKNVPSFDVSVIKEYLPEDNETLSALSELVGLKTDIIKSRLKKATNVPFKPVTLRQDVSFDLVARVEANKIDFPGLQIDVVSGREYIYGYSASHVLGYLGRISQRQLDTPEYRDVPKESFVGRFGVEKIYDRTLMGSSGKKIIEVNATGNIVKVARIQRPVKGRDITLTIDIDLQVEAERSLENSAGSVVALKADTGEVLALASAPSFDPNVFVRGIGHKDWNRLINDPRKPLLNRAIQSRYPPGSTFKIISALAALEEGVVNIHTKHHCSGSIYLGREFKCWKSGGHGDVDLFDAIVQSCDVYFYEIAKNLDIDVLAKYAGFFGIGKETGIGLDGEVSGINPTSQWKMKVKNERWFTGETLNTIIGQGYLAATPIQMARLTAAAVNGGKLYRPYLVKDNERETEPEGVIMINPENSRFVINALQGVVEAKHGTGSPARSKMVSIGGKTGTAQVVGGDPVEGDVKYKHRDHAWFVSFAPVENPEIAVAVFVEHGGHGGSAAAPIAKRIIEAYLKDGKG